MFPGVHEAEERISEFRDRAVKIIQSEKGGKKKISEDSLRDLWNTTKQTNRSTNLQL